MVICQYLTPLIKYHGSLSTTSTTANSTGTAHRCWLWIQPCNRGHKFGTGCASWCVYHFWRYHLFSSILIYLYRPCEHSTHFARCVSWLRWNQQTWKGPWLCLLLRAKIEGPWSNACVLLLPVRPSSICECSNLIYSPRRQEAEAKANNVPFTMKNFIYSQTSSNSVLRGHLNRYHRAEYLCLAAEHGWTVQLVSQNNILRQVIAKPVEVAPRVPFSVDTAIDYIVKFIVAGDQVRVDWPCYAFSLICLFQSLNVVENQQFRDLLTLFRPEFSDEDMPHCTKIRTAIIEAWALWFEELKVTLKVSVY